MRRSTLHPADTETLKDLTPLPVWRHFAELAARPRPSGQEEAVQQYVRSWADSLGLEYVGDDAGNLVVRAPGRGRGVGSEPLMLQGHMDMVCEKDFGVNHDFATDPIRLARDGDELRATGTTLGADNGIGVSIAMAVCDGLYADHPPIELLLTSDEETGMTGAMGLDAGLLRARRMINLDAEEEGTLYIGCAGGCDTLAQLPLERLAERSEGDLVCLRVAGLAGGHSGLDIHLNRGNAIRMLAHALWELRREGLLSVVSLAGGNKRNAIPRDAHCLALVEPAQRASLEAAVTRLAPRLKQLHADSDPGFELILESPSGDPGTRLQPLSEDCTERALELLLATPDGVGSLSATVEGLVETSSNLGVLQTLEGSDTLAATFCSRSSNEAALDLMCARIAMVARRVGGEARTESRYPGWQPNTESALLGTAREVFSQLSNGVAPRVTAIHAGLECGLLGGLVPGLDMISFGPDIRDAHTPRERVSVRSVQVVARQLGALLAALC